MASTIWIISDGVNYHLTTGGAARNFYAGSGTPWTAAATTPYEIQMSEAGVWTPQAAKRIDYWSGGPPFRNGRLPVGAAYDTVEETIPVIMAATSYDNAVKLLRQLRQVLNTARHTIPAILAVKPNGATTTSYFEIYSADVQETPAFINQNAKLFRSPQSKGELFATIVLRRAVGSAAALGNSLSASVASGTFTNRGTSANPNLKAFAALSSDLTHDGVPMNVRFSAASTNSRLYLASVNERIYDTSNAGAYSTPNTSGLQQLASVLALSNEPYAHQGVRARIMLRMSAMASNARVQVRVYLPAVAASIYVSRWRPSTANSGSTLLDMGGFSLEALRRTRFSAKSLVVRVYLKSADGLSAAITFTYMELLTYYTFCEIDASTYGFPASSSVEVNGVMEHSDMLPTPMPPTAGLAPAGTTLYDSLSIRGTPPKYYNGANLYAAWLDGTGNHTTTDTATISAAMPLLGLTLQAP